MTVFMDTSAIFTLLDADDANHDKARKVWSDLLKNETRVVVSNYVLVEAFALLQHRLGIRAVRVLVEDLLPMVGVQWVDDASHASGVAALLAAGQKKRSLVDCVSFILMRQAGIRDVFAFDRHFKQEGFRCLR